MSSIRDGIAAAAVTALGGSGKPTGLNVHRFRTIPIQRDTLPATVVYLIDEVIETGPGKGPSHVAVRNLTLRLEHRIDAGSSTAPDAAVDPYVSWGVKALCTPGALGAGIIEVTEQSTHWDAAEADKVFAAAQTDFLVKYITLVNDPDSQVA